MGKAARVGQIDGEKVGGKRDGGRLTGKTNGRKGEMG